MLFDPALATLGVAAALLIYAGKGRRENGVRL